MYRFVQLTGITAAILGLTTVFNVAPASAGDTQGQAAVMTSGNGVAVSGFWDANGFHGIYSGPKGGGRVAPPPIQKNPPVVLPRVGSGVLIAPGAIMAIADPDDDETGGVSVGTTAGAFAGAGAGAGGAIAIAGPGGVAVGVPGAPLMIVGGGTFVGNDVRSLPRNPSYRGPLPRSQETPGRILPQSGKLVPNSKPAGTIVAPLPRPAILPPLPARANSPQAEDFDE